jgi:hypothetical protein
MDLRRAVREWGPGCGKVAWFDVLADEYGFGRVIGVVHQSAERAERGEVRGRDKASI